ATLRSVPPAPTFPRRFESSSAPAWAARRCRVTNCPDPSANGGSVRSGVTAIDFALSEFQQSLRLAVDKVCARFGDDYWLARDRDGKFPDEFYRTLAA